MALILVADLLRSEGHAPRLLRAWKIVESSFSGKCFGCIRNASHVARYGCERKWSLKLRTSRFPSLEKSSSSNIRLLLARSQPRDRLATPKKSAFLSPRSGFEL